MSALPVETQVGLDRLHHVAISVNDIAAAVDWYRETFRCEIAYQDATWAMLKFDNVSLALVLPNQHPPHLGFVTPTAHQFAPLKRHRDGTESVYISDPSGNAVELLSPESCANS
ncbi:MAG: VOC family protein [Planctomycetaceae bacterium]|nr:VOC family protein [Planctomycetaceae bacterium]